MFRKNSREHAARSRSCDHEWRGCLKFESVARVKRSETRDLREIPDCAEPVIGRAFARPVGSIRATTFRKMTREGARQFNTRLPSGLSSEKVGTSISNFSPLSLTI